MSLSKTDTGWKRAYQKTVQVEIIPEQYPYRGLLSVVLLEE